MASETKSLKSKIIESLNVPDPFTVQIETALKEPTPDYVSLAEIAIDPDKYEKINSYMMNRFGDTGKRQEGESRLQHVKRLESHVRFVNVNTVGQYLELDWTYNQKKQGRENAKDVYALLERTEPFYKPLTTSRGAKGFVKGIYDYGKGLALDPLNYLGFGAASLISKGSVRAAEKALMDRAKKQMFANQTKKATAALEKLEGPVSPQVARGLTELAKKEPGAVKAAEEAFKKAEQLRSKATSTSFMAGATTEGVIAPAQVYMDRELRQARGEQIESSPLDYAIATTFNAILGGASSRALIKPDISEELRLEKIIGSKVRGDKDEKTENLIELIEKNKKEIEDLFHPVVGDKSKMTEVSPETILTTPIIKSEFGKQAVEIVKALIKEEPNYYQELFQQNLKAGGKITDFLNNTIASLDTVSDDVLERAITRSGTSAKELADKLQKDLDDAGFSFTEFAKSQRISDSESARRLAALSSLSRKFTTRLTQFDPETRNALKSLFGEVNNPMIHNPFFDIIRNVERNFKVMLTSAWGTTVRNVIGTGTNLTVNMASDLVENNLFHIANTRKVYKQVKNKQGAFKGGFAAYKYYQAGLADVIKDSTLVLTKLLQSKRTRVEVEKLLEFNPRYLETLDQAVQETGNKELWAVTRFFNSVNMAQDAFFRKAVFMAAVENNLRKAGVFKKGPYKDIYDVMANKVAIPNEVLKNAVDEATKTTMSYRFKRTKNVLQQDFETQAEHLTSNIVEFVETIPLGSVIFTPFPNFMGNALRLQYRLSPFGALSGMKDMRVGSKLMNDAEKLFKKASKETDAKKAKKLKAEAKSMELNGEQLLRRGTQNNTKAIVGTGALMYLIMNEMKNVDTEPGEIKMEDGSTFNTQGIFPLNVGVQLSRAIVDGLRPQILAANDAYIKKTGKGFLTEQQVENLRSLPKVKDSNVKELGEAILGMRIPGGSNGFVFALQKLQDIFSKEPVKTVEDVTTAFGKLMADITGRPLQVLKTPFDYVEIFLPESRKARDPNAAIDPLAEEKFVAPEDEQTLTNQFKNAVGISVDNFVSQIQNKIPYLRETLPLAKQYLKPGPPKRYKFMEVFTAGKVTPDRTRVEKLFNNLRLEPFRLFPRTGIKQYDNIITVTSLPKIIKELNTYMDRTEGSLARPAFKDATPDQKRATVKDIVNKIVRTQKLLIERTYMDIDPVKGLKAKEYIRYRSLSPQDRVLINEEYRKREGKGKSIEETGEYEKHRNYEYILPTKPLK